MAQDILTTSDLTPEEALVHFGIKGMQWGVRRSKKKTGQSRIRGAAAQALYDEARRRRSGAKAKRGGYKGNFVKNYAFNYLGQRVRTQRGNVNTARKEEAAAARILAGKTTVRDFMRAYRRTSIADLIVTTTPITNNNRG